MDERDMIEMWQQYFNKHLNGIDNPVPRKDDYVGAAEIESKRRVL